MRQRRTPDRIPILANSRRSGSTQVFSIEIKKKNSVPNSSDKLGENDDQTFSYLKLMSSLFVLPTTVSSSTNNAAQISFRDSLKRRSVVGRTPERLDVLFKNLDCPPGTTTRGIMHHVWDSSSLQHGLSNILLLPDCSVHKGVHRVLTSPDRPSCLLGRHPRGEIVSPLHRCLSL